MSAVSLRSVSKSFSGAEVIRDVSVEIADGEFCVLVGPSGSGKSTLLRLIAGLEEPNAGEIHIGARDVTHEPPKKRDIAMVFQSYALYPQMTVRDNLGFGLRLAGVARTEAAQKVEAVAEMLGLTALLARFPRELSGGQRQRVAMGRAIVRKPAVFLFDEPLSNLDAALRVQVRGEIVDMHQRLRTTAVYVTHDQVEAMSMGDRIVVLRNGQVEQTGTPHELYQRPANRFVASFIGSPAMNLLEGSLSIDAEGALTFSTGQGRVALPFEVELVDGVAVNATLGLRPEHCLLRPGASATGAQHSAIDGKVICLEFTGADTLVQVATPFGQITAICDDRSPWQRGDAVQVQLPHDRLHLFDAAGLRLPHSNPCLA